MNLNPIGVIGFLVGTVLLYAAVKNKYPQDVIREAMGKPAIHGPLVGGHGTVTHASDPMGPGTGVPVTSV